VGRGAGAAVALSGGKPTAPVTPPTALGGVLPGTGPTLTEKPDATSAAHAVPVAIDAGVVAATPPDAAAAAAIVTPPGDKPHPHKPPGTPVKPPGPGVGKPPVDPPPGTPDTPKEPKEKEIKDPFKTGG